MDPYQSLWMAHWTQAGHSSPLPINQNQTTQDEKREENHDAEHGLTPLQKSKPRMSKSLDADLKVGDVSECKNKLGKQLGSFDITSNVLQSAKDTRRIQSRSLIADLKSTQLDMLSAEKSGSSSHQENLSASSFPYFKNRSSEWKPFQQFDLNKKMEGESSSSTNLSFYKRLRPQFDDKSKYVDVDAGMRVPYVQPGALNSLPNEIHLKTEGRQGTSEQHLGLTYFDRKSAPRLKSLHDDHRVSNSSSMLSKLGGSHRTKEGDHSNLELSHKGHVGNTHSTWREPGRCNNHNYSTVFASGTQIDPKLVARSSTSQSSEWKGGALQLNDDPALSDFHCPTLLGGQDGKMKNFSSTIVLPSYRSIQGASLEDLKCQQYFLHTMPKCSLHDMETVQICTTVDSVEGLPGGPTKFSKTTHHLLFTKKTDMNLSEGDGVPKESTISAELKGKGFCKVLTLHPCFSRCSEQEPEVGHEEKLVDSKEKEDANKTMIGLENESSAETESMPIDFIQSKNSPCGPSSQLHEIQQDFLAGKRIGKSLEGAVSQNREVELGNEGTNLPVTSEELPVDLAADGNVDTMSTSRTESLDAEHLLSHVEQPDNSYSSPQNGNLLDLEPSSRWVKRLKLSASDSLAFGTKSFKMGDASSSDKVSKLFNRITSYSITNLEPTLRKCRGKGLQQFDKAPSLLRRTDFSEDMVKEHQDPSLSHSWIRRWCRSRKATKQARLPAQVTSEPANLRFSLEELQKQQFPSIAAMALMGKAVSNFHPCEFQKKGPLVVWHTKGL